MSQEDLERIRAAHESYVRTGEIPEGSLAPDFELHQASSIVDTAGVFHGREGLRESLRELEGSFDELSFEAERYLEAPGGEVVVLIHARGRGRGSGLNIDNHIAWVWSFRESQAVRLVVYEDQEDALGAVGLSERGAG